VHFQLQFYLLKCYEATLVQYTDKDSELPPSKAKVRKRSKPIQEGAQVASDSDKFLICNECLHNTITYDPSKDGTCECGCH
jgi:hypothetical protein